MPASSQTPAGSPGPQRAKAAPDSPRAYVGLGGSAGSLRAFAAFLAAVGADSGMAYILIAHLAPDHDSMLAGLLGKHTDMPIAQVNEPVRALADHVYVIAPNHDLTIRDGGCIPRRADNAKACARPSIGFSVPWRSIRAAARLASSCRGPAATAAKACAKSRPTAA